MREARGCHLSLDDRVPLPALALSFALRPAASEDREFLFELFARTIRGVVEQTWGWNDGWQRAEFARRFRSYTVSVVESDARPVGGLFTEHGPEAIFIHEIQILPECQGRGIGTAIVPWTVVFPCW